MKEKTSEEEGIPNSHIHQLSPNMHANIMQKSITREACLDSVRENCI